MIDTHVHLSFPDFTGPGAPGVDATLAEASLHGVDGVITISTTVPDAERALAIARSHPRVWCSAGVHPLYSDEGPHDWAELAQLAAQGRCVAWGELGLDRHYAEPAQSVQLKVLEEQLATIVSARRAGVVKPVILHCREAFAELIPVLRASGLPGDGFIFHCFTGGPAEMRMVLDLGALVSFTGVLTYKNAGAVREAAALCPIDRVQVETDGPFLPPEPHRSSRPCKPWMVSLTARTLAQCLGVDTPTLEARLNETTERFFGVPAGELARARAGSKAVRP